ncbi:MAG: SHOCT domain-containing protein [Bacteroidota bacterium]|nr:SHOCT domain-containing protein [Bacteroidota bacterium]
MNDYGYQYFGMHLVWWCIWIVLLFWIFAIPYDIPGQRKKKDTPFDILHKRFALGEINKEEYLDRKKILEHDIPKHTK